MSMRAKLVSAFAAGGILAAGWSIGTLNGQTLESSSAGTTTSAPTNSATSGTSATQSPSSGSSGSTSAGSSTSGSGSGATQASPAATSGKSGTFTGTTVSHEYGTVQVTVTLTNGKITALTQQVLSDGDHHSEMINQRSVPTLRSEILSAGSADGVSTISGATYTTSAYLSSLQSALDKAA